MDQALEEAGSILLVALTLMLVVRLLHQFFTSNGALCILVDSWISQMIR